MKLCLGAKSRCHNEAEDFLCHITSWKPHLNILKDNIQMEFSEAGLVNRFTLLLLVTYGHDALVNLGSKWSLLKQDM